jgi:exosortase
METEIKQSALAHPPGLYSDIVSWSRLFPAEFGRCWRQLPNKSVFFPLLIVWFLLFHFLGNATFGYVDTASLLQWMKTSYCSTTGEAQDSHGLLIPPLVLVLLWLRRKELLSLHNRLWWPALFLLLGALILHIVGYLVQQPRVSIVAFFGGIYALAGLAWGPGWMRATFFPFFLFFFCIPITAIGEPVTVPLRRLVTHITAMICNFFGMDVHGEGTQLFNSAHTFQYEVAAACSGMRSFIAILVLTIVYGFVSFDKNWKRALIILSGFPLAVIGNVIRLLCIAVSAELWGQSTGNFVHENWFFSLVPYVPAILGVMYLGRWLGERHPETAPPAPPALAHQP